MESESSHDLVESSQNRFTISVELLQIIGLKSQVNVEPKKIHIIV